MNVRFCRLLFTIVGVLQSTFNPVARASSLRSPSAHALAPADSPSIVRYTKVSVRAKDSVTTLSEKDAQSLFAFLASDSNQIAYRENKDGCTDRATAMVALARDIKKINVGKIWADADFAGGQSLQAKSRIAPGGFWSWKHHVAVFVWVRDAAGQRKPLVIDPSLFGMPVSREAWSAALSAGPTRARFDLALTTGDAQSRENEIPIPEDMQRANEKMARDHNEMFWAQQQHRERGTAIPASIAKRIRAAQADQEEMMVHGSP